MIVVSNLVTKSSLFVVKRILTVLSKPSVIITVYVAYKSAKLFMKTRKLNKFTEYYYTPNREYVFGTFMEFVHTMRKSVSDGSISEAFLHWRISKFEQARKSESPNGAWVFKTLPWRQLLYVEDPQLVNILTNVNPAYVTKGGFAEDILLTDKNGFEHGLVMLEHKQWHDQRKVISKMFQATALEGYLDVMDQSAMEFVNQLSQCNTFGEHAFSVSRSFIYEILFKCLFGDYECECQSNSSYDETINIFATLGNIINWKVRNLPLILFVQNVPILGSLLARFVGGLNDEKEMGKKRDQYIQNIVETARKNYKAGHGGVDIASVLIKSQGTLGGRSLSDGHIKAHLFTFLFAGHETTLAALYWAIYYLGEHDDCRQKIKEEFEQLGGKITRETLQKAEYTTAFINEVLRLCHVVDMMVPRKLLRDVRLPDGRVMPKEMQYIIDIGSIHRGETYKDPTTFNPDRFLSRQANTEKYTFIPFGAGKRNCVGLNFAIQLLKIALFRISSNIKVENLDKGVCNQMEGVSWRPKSGTLHQRFSLL